MYRQLIILVFIAVVFCNDAVAQRGGSSRKKEKQQTYLKLQQVTNYRGVSPLHFTNFELGLVKTSESAYKELSILYSKYYRDGEIIIKESTMDSLAPYDNIRGAVYQGHNVVVEYYHAPIILNTNFGSVNFGWFSSLGYYYDLVWPYGIVNWPDESRFLLLSVGPKANLIASLTERINLNVSTKHYLLDAGILRNRLKDPTLQLDQQVSHDFHINLIRNSYYLSIGFNVQLGK